MTDQRLDETFRQIRVADDNLSEAMGFLEDLGYDEQDDAINKARDGAVKAIASARIALREVGR